MSVLNNQRHERYAQGLAKGQSQADAYAEAGYRPSKSGASILFNKDDIKARVAELQERGAVKTGLTVAKVTESLLRLAEKGEAEGGSKGLNMARAAWMDAAKINGLIVDRKEVGAPGDFTQMSDHELARIAKGLSSEGTDTPPIDPTRFN